MVRLGYSSEQVSVAGPDAYNYQGVGNPHRLAEIGGTERVLDLRSGLGIDSFVAASLTNGEVVGIDLSPLEVGHAQRRAAARQLHPQVSFLVTWRRKKAPVADDSFDVVISNGTVCLTPDKRRAFSEVRTLRPPTHTHKLHPNPSRYHQLSSAQPLPAPLNPDRTLSDLVPSPSRPVPHHPISSHLVPSHLIASHGIPRHPTHGQVYRALRPQAAAVQLARAPSDSPSSPVSRGHSACGCSLT